MINTDLLKALDFIKSGNYQTGADLEAAHAICQGGEGIAEYDWVHAFVDRIEGDSFNADYWYKRAGKPAYDGSFEEEWLEIKSALT
ncbi:MAG: hypothetical protein ABJO86_03165 [Lentilitoribacter sp.]